MVFLQVIGKTVGIITRLVQYLFFTAILVYDAKFSPPFIYRDEGEKLSISPFVRGVLSPSSLQTEGKVKQKIPLLIHQTRESEKLTPANYAASASLISMNHEYTYNFYTDKDCRKFIVKNFPARVADAFDALIPGAYKADLFRLCVLYIQGGIYIDCKSTTIFPFRDFIPADSELCMFKDVTPAYLMNGFIASIPQHPFIYSCIEEIVHMVSQRRYGYDQMDISGPRMMKRVFDDIRQKEDLFREELSYIRYTLKDEMKDYTADIVGGLGFTYQYFYNKEGIPVISRINSDYKPFSNILGRYELNWILGTVYR